MRRGFAVGFVALVAICVVLAIAVASIGTQLDEARLERDDLEFEVEDLRTETETLRTERDTLKTQAEDQLKTIEQLKVELERVRGQAQGSSATSTP